MKNAKELAMALVKASAERALRRDTGRATCNAIFQPKVPAGLNRFKKEKR